jgi:anion transporter
MKPATLISLLVIAASAVVFVMPPPAGFEPGTMRAAALVLFTVGLWAAGALPEHVTGFLFFTIAMIFAVAPAHVVFSGFASATLWLVLGGLIMAEAVNRTGLARRLAGAVFGRYAGSYRRLIVAVVVAAVVLSFLMPATVSRVLLLIPIIAAAAQRLGFERGSTGYNGLCLAALMATYQCGTAILPANAPNLVLAGSAEALYGMPINYAEYLWLQFPVMGLLKGMAIVVFICWLFRAEVRPAELSGDKTPLTPQERRMAVILVLSLALWATDFLHGIKAGWIALAAGVACILPRVGVMPVVAFNDVRMGPVFYVAATLGIGLVTQETGLSDALGRALHGVLPLAMGADFMNFMTLSMFSTVAGVFTTNPAQPAVLAPLAAYFAEATGWPLKTALMTIGVGFTMFLLPHQVPPVVVGMHVAALKLSTVLRLSLPLVAFSIVVLWPLHFLWWWLIGSFTQ